MTEASDFFNEISGEISYESVSGPEGRVALTAVFEAAGRAAEQPAAGKPAARQPVAKPSEGWAATACAWLLDRSFGTGVLLTSDQREVLDGALLTARRLLREERTRTVFDPLWDFDFCTEEEIALYDRNGEYRRFQKAWEEDGIYVLMRLSQELTPYRTLNHIAGVHHVAVTVARGLASAGEAVNPAMLSAAAALHDIGKFGCRPGERVPYLHYYYTDKWCTSRGIRDIGRIAANHSAWDLEAENLSAESLALIYADFRVKQTYENGCEQTHFYTLRDSYDVILNKLDNVDAAKQQRYRLVYAKLFDFERFMISRGVDVTLQGRPVPLPEEKNCVFYNDDELVEAYHLMAVRDNIRQTRRFGQERLFSELLEAMRSESDWIRVQAYLSIIREYYNYLNSDQKQQTLDALFDLLVSPERDISREAASIMGLIVARFNTGYRKQMPDKSLTLPDDDIQIRVWKVYLEKLLRPDRSFTPRQRSYLHYVLGIFVQNTIIHTLERDEAAFRTILLSYYARTDGRDAEEELALMQTAPFIPLDRVTEADIAVLNTFAFRLLDKADLRFKAAALLFFREELGNEAVRAEVRRETARRVADSDPGSFVSLRYLQQALLRRAGLPVEEGLETATEEIREIFLDDFKTATPWIIKKVNVLYLENVRPSDGDYLHIATHLANLIEVSEIAAVRYSAGEALLRVCGRLTADQKNEVALELARGLEVGQFEYSKYIPTSLGRFVLYLREPELDEIIDHFQDLLQSPNDSTVVGTMSTICIMLEYYDRCRPEAPAAPARFEARRRRLLGMVLKQLASHREIARQEALLTLSRGIFGSVIVTPERKAAIFSEISRSMLFILRETREDYQTRFFQSAMLAHIYRFILSWESGGRGFALGSFDKVAFFPGTFDPFSLSHKEIVRRIRDMGFEVYLAIDEFSWRKKTEPSLIRRRIAVMSVADEYHVTLFPHDISINIANADDLAHLQSLFPGRSVYLVVGSDVVTGASAYRSLAAEPIHTMNHIVIRRDTEQDEAVEEKLAGITGDVVRVCLPEPFGFISSSLIRDNIDRNVDNAGLLDASAMTYISENGLYRHEPMFKPVIRPGSRQVDLQETAGGAVLTLTSRKGAAGACAEAAVRVIRSAELYHALGDRRQAELIRSRETVRLMLIDELGLVNPENSRGEAGGEALQQLLTDVLVYGIEKDCDHALFSVKGSLSRRALVPLLMRQGFRFADEEARDILLVSLRSPVVLFRNIDTVLKDLFSENEAVRSVLTRTNRRLQEALTAAYPGEAVLSFHARHLYDRLLNRIAALNHVPEEPVEPRRLGEAMCVPFGKVLRGVAVPNTVTKTIYTERVYEPDLRSNEIRAFPNYAPLRSQVRMIRSFERPVILVDDMLNSPSRLRMINALFREEAVDFRKLLVCVITSRGRDMIEEAGIDVDWVYFIPNMKAWYTDVGCYPFIGGDAVKSFYEPVPGFRAAINRILPYTVPPFAGDRQGSCDFSRVCLENARDILTVLETEYRRRYARNLTLSRLSDVIDLPLCPDKGTAMCYDPNREASYYVENDLRMLERLKGML